MMTLVLLGRSPSVESVSHKPDGDAAPYGGRYDDQKQQDREAEPGDFPVAMIPLFGSVIQDRRSGHRHFLLAPAVM
jgi:hypothetical protein